MIRWILGRGRHLGVDELSAYADGSLGARASARVKAHLAACDSSCASDLAGLRTTLAILRSVPTARAPRSFALRPEQVAVRRPETTLRLPWYRSPVVAPAFAATLAAVVFGLVLVGNLTGAISQSGGSVETRRNAVVVTVVVEKQVVAEKTVAARAVPESEGAVAPEATPAPAVAAQAAVGRAESSEKRLETVVVEKEAGVGEIQAAPSRAPEPRAELAAPAREARAAAEAAPPEAARAAAPTRAELKAAPTSAPVPEASALEAASPEAAITAAAPQAELGTATSERAIEAEAAPTPAAAPAPAPGNAALEAAANDGVPAPAGDIAPEAGARVESERPPVTAAAPPAPEGEPGLRLPVWQLEILFGLLAAGFALVALVLSRRGRWRQAAR